MSLMLSETQKLAGRQDVRVLLLDEFSRRKARNPAYSLRAFARFLGVNKTTLSAFLAEKRHLSRKNLACVLEKLEHLPSAMSQPRQDLSDDLFHMISDWYHYALLNLVRVPTISTDPDYLAKRLGISKFEALAALERLHRLGFIRRAKGKWVRTVHSLVTQTDIPSSALRKYHRQNLRLAENSLETDPIDRREFQAITMAVDPAKLPYAKRLISEFKSKMEALLEAGDPKEVYTLAVQLFPVTRAAAMPVDPVIMPTN